MTSGYEPDKAIQVIVDKGNLALHEDVLYVTTPFVDIWHVYMKDGSMTVINSKNIADFTIGKNVRVVNTSIREGQVVVCMKDLPAYMNYHDDFDCIATGMRVTLKNGEAVDVSFRHSPEYHTFNTNAWNNVAKDKGDFLYKIDVVSDRIDVEVSGEVDNYDVIITKKK